jgi:hypothetical protein
MPDIKKIETEVWEPHPEKKGWMQKVRDKTVGEVYKEIIDLLKEHKLYDRFSMFFINNSTSSPIKLEDSFPLWSQIACYAVAGSNEGFFVCVDVRRADDPSNSETYFIGRTHEDINFALEAVNLLTRAFYGNRR